MKELSTEDRHHLAAAEGWLGLGVPAEARKELEELSAPSRAHPAVLEVRWQILAVEGQWEAGLEIASHLIRSRPERALGWVHRSYCLHELKRTSEARDNLLQVVETFAEDPILRYNLACYECQLGHLEEAKRWLRQAFALGDAQKIRATALEDPDLQPLWEEIALM